jgi:TRAP-type mannitol/chloroaromatic compound transport system permease small subunit
LKRTILRLRRAFGRILLGATLLSGVICFVMMWLIDANALSRKIFNAPVPGGVELTQSLLTASIMLPFGYVLFRGEHVNTVFLTSRFSKAANRFLYLFWMTVGFLLFCAVAYGSFNFALRSYAMNEQVWGATVRFPLYPAKFAVTVGAVLIAVQFALEALVALVTHGDGDLSAAMPDHEKDHLHV